MLIYLYTWQYLKRWQIYGALFFFVIFSSSAHAAQQTISASFDDAQQFSSFSGAALASGSLILSDDGVFLTENFNAYADGAYPTGWTRDTIDWSIKSGKYVNLSASYDNSTTLWAEKIIKNGEISADITTLGGEHLAGIIFRAKNNANFYLASFSALYDFVGITKVESGAHTTIASLSENYLPYTSYKLRVLFNNTHIEIFVNEIKKLEVYDSVYTSAGNLGFWRTGTPMETDNLVVQSLTYASGVAISKSTVFNANIKSAKLTLNGSPANLIHAFVSSTDGDTWDEINAGETINFEQTGSKFRYKIYLERGSQNPTVDSLTFILEEGAPDAQTALPLDLPILHYNSTGNSRARSADPSKLRYVRELPKVKVVQQAAILKKDAASIAYLANSDQRAIIAYDITNAKTLWSANINGYTETTPRVHRGIVYIGSYEPKLYALSQDSGAVLWTFPAQNAVSGGNIDIKNDVVYFTDYGYSGTSTLYAVQTQTAKLLWSRPVPVEAFYSLTVDPQEDKIYAAYSSTVVSIKTDTGELIWRNDINAGSITKQPVISGDKLVIGADMAILALDKQTGETIWRNKENFSQTNDGIGAAPVVKDGIVYYPSKNTAKLFARRLNDGLLVWSSGIQGGKGTFSSPVLTDDGYIYLAFDSGVRVFRASDGSEVWKSNEPAWNENNVALAHGYMLFTDPAGEGSLHIYQVAAKSPAPIEIAPPPTPSGRGATPPASQPPAQAPHIAPVQDSNADKEQGIKKPALNLFAPGSLIKANGDIKIYVTNGFGYKRHILNPEIFAMYRHLKWENVHDVDQEIVNSYATSILIRLQGGEDVYLLRQSSLIQEKAVKHHLKMTERKFLEKYDARQIFTINGQELEYYKDGYAITSNNLVRSN